MPRKNTIKNYVTNGIYHIYNRGVDKRIIFQDTQDYQVFLKLLKDSLLPPQNPLELLQIITVKGSTFKGIPRQPLNFYQKIELLAYCLMPNHFHLMILQKAEKSMKQFMQSFSTRYAMYFNKKYKRVGSLFQGIYRAVLITEEAYLLHLSRYIHLNPKEITQNHLDTYSSYPDYIGKRNTRWLNPNIILSNFGSSFIKQKSGASYQKFVEDYSEDSTEILGNLTLEGLNP